MFLNLCLKDLSWYIKNHCTKTFIFRYIVLPKPGKQAFDLVANKIKQSYGKQSGIVYCLSRKDCERASDTLNQVGVSCKPYHAGLTDMQRTGTQRDWLDDKVQVVCATIAFGMGIDKHDVRFVIHNTLPKSVEGFYQESGRAGRDGDPADCILYYNYSDTGRIKNLIFMDKTPAANKTRQVQSQTMYFLLYYFQQAHLDGKDSSEAFNLKLIPLFARCILTTLTT